MSTRTDELARTLPMAMRTVFHRLAKDLSAAGLEITASQFGMLDFLLQNDAAVQTDLANHLYKDKSAILRQLDQLERNGWVERQLDPVDRRRKNLVVCKAGQDVHRKAAKVRDRIFAEVLNGVSDKELATMTKVLGRMANSSTATLEK